MGVCIFVHPPCYIVAHQPLNLAKSNLPRLYKKLNVCSTVLLLTTYQFYDNFNFRTHHTHHIFHLKPAFSMTRLWVLCMVNNYKTRLYYRPTFEKQTTKFEIRHYGKSILYKETNLLKVISNAVVMMSRGVNPGGLGVATPRF